ncbi:hypothetical protein GCM10018952_56110 [Streptosporangium vulgare]
MRTFTWRIPYPACLCIAQRRQAEKNAAAPPISHMRDHHDAVPVTGAATGGIPGGTHAIGAAPGREHLARPRLASRVRLSRVTRISRLTCFSYDVFLV